MTQRYYNPHAVIAAVTRALSPIWGIFEQLRRTYEFTTSEFWLAWRITNYFLWILNFSHIDPYKRVRRFLRTFDKFITHKDSHSTNSTSKRHVERGPGGPGVPPPRRAKPCCYRVPHRMPRMSKRMRGILVPIFRDLIERMEVPPPTQQPLPQGAAACPPAQPAPPQSGEVGEGGASAPGGGNSYNDTS